MAVYIGVDLHVRTETVCWMNTADGEIHQHTLDHSRDDLRAFYAQFTAPAVVGIESSGYALWFHQLMEQAGHRLLVGDAYAIRQFARRRQKNDRRDAELLLDLLRRDEFPVVHRPAPPSQDTLALLRYRHRLVRMRTMVKNGVQAVALNHQLRLGFRLFTRRGHQPLRPHLQAGQPPAAVPAGGSGLERRATRRRPGTVLPPLAGAEETPCGNGGGGGAQAGAAPVPHVAGRHRLRGVPAPGSRRAACPTMCESRPAGLSK